MATLAEATEAAEVKAVAKAEIAIEKILRGLAHDCCRKIGRVEIDTENFPTPAVEITLSEASCR